jgi:pimeloyl-ACP methyl ester carboxylesterase
MMRSPHRWVASAISLDYYERSSAMPHLHRITQPTVIIHAEDDPFIDPADFHRASFGSGVHLHLEKHGGHLGYVALRPAVSALAGLRGRSLSRSAAGRTLLTRSAISACTAITARLAVLGSEL